MDYYDKIISILDKPYFKNLISIGVTEDHYEEIFKRIYNEKIIIVDEKYMSHKRILLIDDINDKFNNKTLYYEYSNGDWYRYEYQNGKEIYYEDSNGIKY
jgi:hypoxanthine phosphoribosyltransferase